VAIASLTNDRRIVGNHVNSQLPNAVAWSTAIFVALATVALPASGFF